MAPRQSLTLSVRGQRGLAANFFAADREIAEAVRLHTLSTGVRVHAGAVERAPVDLSEDADDFVMREKIRLMVSPGGLAFEVGYLESDFSEADQPPYFIFQEEGFHHYLTGEYIRNPHLEPAYRAEERNYRDGVRSAVLAAIARLPGAA